MVVSFTTIISLDPIQKRKLTLIPNGMRRLDPSDLGIINPLEMHLGYLNLSRDLIFCATFHRLPKNLNFVTEGLPHIKTLALEFDAEILMVVIPSGTPSSAAMREAFGQAVTSELKNNVTGGFFRSLSSTS